LSFLSYSYLFLLPLGISIIMSSTISSCKAFTSFPIMPERLQTNDYHKRRTPLGGSSKPISKHSYLLLNKKTQAAASSPLIFPSLGKEMSQVAISSASVEPIFSTKASKSFSSTMPSPFISRLSSS